MERGSRPGERNQPAVKLFIILPILLLAGCVTGPVEPFNSEYFSQRPEIWEKEGGYYLRLYEPTLDPIGISMAQTEVVGQDVYVWISGRHSAGSNPNRLLPLGMSVSPEGRAPRFLWRDPDGSLHLMEIRRV